jgi:hypothetical protein
MEFLTRLHLLADMEGSSRSMFEGVVTEFAWMDREKPRKNLCWSEYPVSTLMFEPGTS